MVRTLATPEERISETLVPVELKIMFTCSALCLFLDRSFPGKNTSVSVKEDKRKCINPRVDRGNKNVEILVDIIEKTASLVGNTKEEKKVSRRIEFYHPVGSSRKAFPN